MTPQQISQVQSYLRKRFGTETVTLKPRKVKDSVEVYLDDEILGLLYIDDEDKDDISYDLNISILQDDLDAG
ncbi:hypothetical protein GCM10011309_07010 [Litorimonas cladophorae]|jgi:hypothetical protein|uniref:DUF3126 family protein n=1 Tax=Litorimonas cladophorae TaxID=1220491 RepID=A0A918KE71_9PROT|nr:DUF3126 family protein [Litorimonas cladophorae]GGX59806.1 hypothetical protein GCM10011309_07010 [Litorimonas cladophorae]